MSNNPFSIKATRKKFRDGGIFHTQEDLALRLKKLLPDDIKEVYDPTCGVGGLLAVFPDHVKKYGQEIDADMLRAAQDSLVNFHGVCADVLSEPHYNCNFEAIVANPPFSIKYSWTTVDTRIFEGQPVMPPQSKADWAFMAHILTRLSPTGTAVVLCHPGIGYRGNAEGMIRKWYIENNLIDEIVFIPGRQFVDTQIPTMVLVLKKNRTTSDIKVSNSTGSKVITTETLEEVDYKITESWLLPQEIERVEIDINSVSQDLNARVMQSIVAHITMGEMLQKEMGNNHIEGFKKSLIELADTLKSVPSTHHKNDGVHTSKTEQ